MVSPIDVAPEHLARVCQRWHIRRLRLFGSALGSGFRQESDVDLLVEFADGHTPGLSIIDLEEELSSLFGHPVDLVNPKFLIERLRTPIEAAARVIYES